MGLKHVWILSQVRPGRHEARHAIRYLRYYDPRTYRAVNKFFQTKYGIQPEEWADALIEGGRFRRYAYIYRRYFPRHDWGRHFAIMGIASLPFVYYGKRVFWWAHGDYDRFKLGVEFKNQVKRACYYY